MSYLLGNGNIVKRIKTRVRYCSSDHMISTIPYKTLASKLILDDILLDDILPVTHLVLTLLFFNALEDLYDCQEMHEAHDKKDHEDDDEQEGPDVLHGRVSRGVDAGVGEEGHDPGPETEDEHDVEGEPGEEEEGPGPEDTDHEEAVTDQLAGETRQDEVERIGTSIRQMLLMLLLWSVVRPGKKLRMKLARGPRRREVGAVTRM